MKRTAIWTCGLLAALALAVGGCTQASGTQLRVVTSTSLLANVVREVGGSRVQVVNLVPPSQHPGNFDVKPGDVEKLAGASLFLLHGWPGEGYADKMITAAGNPALKVVKVTVNGNWMTPPMELEAAVKVAEVLGEADPGNSDAYRKSAETYRGRVAAKEAEIKSKLVGAGVSRTNVIASARQADFLQWAGFNVVASYGEANTLTPLVVKDLVDRGRQAKVTLVVDNLQSAPDAGAGIAQELGARRLTLSNFPGGFDNTETWEKAIDRNVELLLKAVAP